MHSTLRQYALPAIVFMVMWLQSGNPDYLNTGGLGLTGSLCQLEHIKIKSIRPVIYDAGLADGLRMTCLGDRIGMMGGMGREVFSEILCQL